MNQRTLSSTDFALAQVQCDIYRRIDMLASDDAAEIAGMFERARRSNGQRYRRAMEKVSNHGR